MERMLLLYAFILLVLNFSSALVEQETKNVPILVPQLPTAEGNKQVHDPDNPLTLSLHGPQDRILGFLERVIKPPKCSDDGTHHHGEQEKHVKKAECKEPFVAVNRFCLFVKRSTHMTWEEGRAFCRERGADLVVFRNANEFADILQHLKILSGGKKNRHYWVGGSDIQDEGNWVWLDGSPMPRGTPFWANVWSDGSYLLEPDGGKEENCAMFYGRDSFYLHDVACSPSPNPSWKITAVCEYGPK